MTVKPEFFYSLVRSPMELAMKYIAVVLLVCMFKQVFANECSDIAAKTPEVVSDPIADAINSFDGGDRSFYIRWGFRVNVVGLNVDHDCVLKQHGEKITSPYGELMHYIQGDAILCEQQIKLRESALKYLAAYNQQMAAKLAAIGGECF